MFSASRRTLSLTTVTLLTAVVLPADAGVAASVRPGTSPTVHATDTCRGMTWSIRNRQLWRNVVEPHGDFRTDAYAGDTNCAARLPILCLKKAGLPKPAGLATNFYEGWSGGYARLTEPVAGTKLTSRAVANGYCSAKFGVGFRMGEHHDGNGGWGWWGRGDGFRAWVTSSGRPVNPWDTTNGKALSWTVAGQEWASATTTFAADYRSDPATAGVRVSVHFGLLCVKTVNGTVNAALTDPVRGDALGSRAQADGLCATTFGGGWTAADVDRIGASSLRAHASVRMWVAINDQPANPWN